MSTKYAAGLSLAFMGLGFVITLFLPDSTWILLLRGGFEAGLVGGAADWFAVTALFRHPFGLPIPHTSLIIRNRGKMVQTLVSAMENELLNKRSIEEMLRQHQVLGAAAVELTRLIQKRSVRTAVVDFLLRLLDHIPEEKAVRLLQEKLSGLVRHNGLGGMSSALRDHLSAADYERKVLDLGLKEALVWVKRPETRYLLGKLANEKMSGIKVGGFMGFAVQAFAGFMDEDKLGQIIQEMLMNSLRQLQLPEDPYRERILLQIRTQLLGVLEDKERSSRMAEAVSAWIGGPQAYPLLEAGYRSMLEHLSDWLLQERMNGGRAVFQAYRFLYRSIISSPELVRLLESRTTEYILDFVEANHYRIGNLVKLNLERMDDATLVRLIEEKVGSDLQWIRVNGAICGFLVGLLLSVVQLWHGGG
ncbi:DUF445 domain-containing protein [Gorillibacterium sp. sgz5001074]|uniref:DUF445 domain-containing protein n=1 Tax=Gorillibacterium sp. sgz5001074 TaxID=3446695 RepID=UPI003F67BB16